MIVLGIDTSAAVSTVCLTDGNKPLALFTLFSMTEHSVALLPMIEEALTRSGKTLTDLDLICVSSGPGSFTGIRIGISTVKGLAFATSIPCVGVSALEAMAYLFSDTEGYVLPLIDARRDTVYTSLFYSDGKGGIRRLTDDNILAYSEAAKIVPSGEKVFLVGDGKERAEKEFSDDALLPVPEMIARQCGYGVALCGLKRYENLKDDEKESLKGGADLKPVYLRKSLPERLREDKE